MNTPLSQVNSEEMSNVMPLQTFALLLAASAVGALAAILVLPNWLPALNASLEGGTPQAFWFLARSSAMVAYGLLWLSMILGLSITNKLAQLWPGGPIAFDLHQFTSLLGTVFALFHGLILLGDRFLNTTFVHTLVPFAMSEYRPGWVGLGQVGFYSMVLVSLSFYVRKQITPRRWRAIHFLSFATYLMVLVHGIASGTDTQGLGMQEFYWSTGGLFILFLFHRILTSVFRQPISRQTA